jgi:VanZ family protein
MNKGKGYVMSGWASFIRYWLPLLLLVLLIFFSSSQPYEKQDLRPMLARYMNMHMVEYFFSGVVFSYAGKEISVHYLGPAGFIEFFIRKGAHFTTNFIIGFLFFRAWHTHFRHIRSVIIASILGVVLLAIGDEFHQMITPNRTPLVADAVLDSLGGLTGITLAFIFYTAFFGRKKQDVS